MSWITQHWESVLNALAFVASVAGLVASVLAYRQAEQAAIDARSAEKRSEEAIVQARETTLVVRQDSTKRTILHHFVTAQSMGEEIQNFMVTKKYEAVLLRCVDLGKHLSYLIKRWDAEVPSSSFAALVDANAKTEQMVERLQEERPVNQSEHAKLLRVVKKIASSLADEYTLAEKRREGNG